MTDNVKLIARAKAALDGVTDGPWEAVPEYDASGIKGNTWVWIGPQKWDTRIARVVLYPDNEAAQYRNANFIAQSRQLVPDLIAALEKAEAKLDAISEAWSMSIYGDLEHGVSSVNERVQYDFAKKYPNISGFGRDLDRIIHGEDNT